MKKKILAAAVSAAITGGLGTAQMANADSVLGPLFSSQDGVLTFVSIVTKSTGQTLVPTHWIYLWKEGDLAEALTTECQHSDGFGDQTANDLGTFFLGTSNFGGANVPGTTLYQDVDGTSDGFFIGTGRAGMFTVSDYVGNASGFSEASIYGEVLIVDIITGDLFSYRMLNDPVETREANFDDIAYGSLGSEVFYTQQPITVPPNNEPAPPTAVWQRQSDLAASWFVMAPRDNMILTDVPDLSLTIAFAGSRITDGDPDVAGIEFGNHDIGNFWNRDEELFSTSSRPRFTCIAELGPDDFIDSGSIVNALDGGWAHVEIVNKNPLNALEATRNIGLLVYKLEASGGRSVFTSENHIDF